MVKLRSTFFATALHAHELYSYYQGYIETPDQLLKFISLGIFIARLVKKHPFCVLIRTRCKPTVYKTLFLVLPFFVSLRFNPLGHELQHELIEKQVWYTPLVQWLDQRLICRFCNKSSGLYINLWSKTHVFALVIKFFVLHF